MQWILRRARQTDSSSHNAHTLAGKRNNKQANISNKGYFHNAEEQPWKFSPYSSFEKDTVNYTDHTMPFGWQYLEWVSICMNAFGYCNRIITLL